MTSRVAAASTPGRKAAIAGAVDRGLAAAAGALSTIGAATYFARRVLTPDRQRPDDTQILAVDDDSVTLGVSPDTVQPGRYGLWLDGDRGHARVGEVLERRRGLRPGAP